MQVSRFLGFCTLFVAAAGPASAQDDPLLSRYEPLLEPRIATLDARPMLVVTAQGDPNVVGPAAFGLLFQLYYSVPETPKAAVPTPRARWPEDLSVPPADWIGRYGLPVPEAVAELPSFETREGLEAALRTWEYGEVAEILHVGPYDEEEPTVARLLDFVRASGYETVGGHEEEYLRGPTMSGPGDPERYLTIIRYRVRKP